MSAVPDNQPGRLTLVQPVGAFLTSHPDFEINAPPIEFIVEKVNLVGGAFQNAPGAATNPKPPAHLGRHPALPGQVHLTYSTPAGTGHFRWFGKGPGDADFVFVEDTADAELLLEGLASGQAVEFYVTAVNPAGEGVPSVTVGKAGSAPLAYGQAGKRPQSVVEEAFARSPLLNPRLRSVLELLICIGGLCAARLIPGSIQATNQPVLAILVIFD